MTRAMKLLMSLVMISLIGVLPLSVSPVQASTSIFLEDFGPSWVPGTQWSLAQSASFTAQVSTSGSETPNSALRLTSASTQKAGGLLYGTPIPTEFGLDIAFHFSMWGGTGADGINFFLQKGTETSFCFFKKFYFANFEMRISELIAILCENFLKRLEHFEQGARIF